MIMSEKNTKLIQHGPKIILLLYQVILNAMKRKNNDYLPDQLQ